MKVIFKDDTSNLIVAETNTIIVDHNENCIAMKIIDADFPFICKNLDLVKNFNQIIKHELDSAYIDFSNYIFIQDDKYLIRKQLLCMIQK